MAAILKTPKTLKIKMGRRLTNGDDDYESYMKAVLQQAVTHPDVATAKRTH